MISNHDHSDEYHADTKKDSDKGADARARLTSQSGNAKRKKQNIVPNFSEVDPWSWDWTQKAREMSNGKGKNWYINVSPTNKTDPEFQFPRLGVPFGPNCSDGLTLPETVEKEYKMKLPVNVPANDEGDTLSGFLTVIDNAAIKAAQDRRGELWSAKKTEEDIKSAYKELEKENNEYGNRFTLKMLTRGENATKIYVVKERNGKKYYDFGSIEDIKRGCEILPIVSCRGCWVIPAIGFGVDLICKNILVFPKTEAEDFPFTLEDEYELDTGSNAEEPFEDEDDYESKVTSPN